MQIKLLGNDHPSLATTLNNLALVLRDEGKFSESEANLRRTLEIRRKHFGDDHPSVTAALTDLTNVITQGKQSEYGEAIRE